MNAIAVAIALQFDAMRRCQIVLTLKDPRNINDLQDAIGRGKVLDVEVKQHRERRSLDANAYFWKLLDTLAGALHTTKDELYLEMLDRYGVFTHIIVKPEAVEKVKHEWRLVRELSRGSVGGVEGVQLQCFFGSSSYDSKEMSRLIEGLISECKECGIETLPPDEVARLTSAWGEEK